MAPSAIALIVCVLIAHRLAVSVSVGVGHVHTVAMSSPGGQSDVNGVANLLGTIVLRCCVCVAIAVVGPTMVTQGDRGGLGMRA